MREKPDGTTTRRRLLTGLAIFLTVFSLIAWTASDAGLTWDEAIYYRFAIEYMRWFDSPAFDASSLARTWGAGQVHPPLGKLWIAGSFALFGGFADVITAARLGAGLLFAATAAALYLWLARLKNERVGLMAALALVLMPRMFAHGHFANLGMPSLFLWVITVIAFERGIHKRGWSVVCGAAFGLALLTKVDAFFLPVVLGPWGLLFHGKKAVRNLVAMAVAGPIFFIAGWPVFWHHPVEGVRGFLAYWSGLGETKRGIVPTYYLGRVYRESVAPWHYAIVMLLATTPLPILAAAAAGAAGVFRGIRARRHERGLEALILWNAVFFVGIFSAPGLGKYDGVRLMMPSLGFLAALAALGGDAAWLRIRARARNAKNAACALGAVLLAWLILPVMVLHPFQLCYYGELVGGPWGAERFGFETTYWNDTLTQEALDFINARAPARARVAKLGVGDKVWQMYKALSVRDEETGRVTQGLRQDLLDGEFESGRWDLLVVCPRQSMLTDEQRRFITSHDPIWANYLPPFGKLGVCLIYQNPG